MLNRRKFWLTWISYSCFIIVVIIGTLWNLRVPFLSSDPIDGVQHKITRSLTKLNKLNETSIVLYAEQQETFKGIFSVLKPHDNDQWLYVFKNKNLVYWSNYHYVPHWSNVENIKHEGVISDSKGKYLASKKVIVDHGTNYTFVSITPLYTDYPIANNYLRSGFNKDLFKTSKGRMVISPTSGFFNVTNTEGDFIFGYVLEEQHLIQGAALGVFLLVLLTMYMVWLYRRLVALYFTNRQYSTELQFFLLIGLFIIYRFIVTAISKYNMIDGVGLFDSSKFAYSVLSPSIGDFLINITFLFLLSSFVYRHYKTFFATKYILKLSACKKQFFVLLLISISYVLFMEMYKTMDVLQRNSQSIFDITSSVTFDWLRIISLLVLLIAGLSYFYLNHVIIRISVQCISIKRIALNAFLITLISIGILYFLYPAICLLPVIHLCFLLIVLLTGYIKEVSLMRYQAYLYFFFYAIELAWIVAFAIQGYYVEKLNRDKEKYFFQLFVDNDIQGEYLLHDALENINQDSYLKNVLLSPFSDKRLIDQKIRKIHLSNYFDKFEVSVHLFDVNYKNYNDTTGRNDLGSYFKKVLRPKYKTQFPNIYLVEEASSSDSKKYYCLQKINYGNVIAGYVLIELKYKKLQPNSVYPELLVDKKYRKYIPVGVYTYAVYDGSRLIYSDGTLNYFSSISDADRKILIKQKDGIFKGDIHHWGKVDSNGQLVIISSEASQWYVLITNFSFLFILNVFLLLVLVSVNLILFMFSAKSISYASRIQIYINIAFFLPLVIMSIVSLSVITNNYKEGLNKKTTHVASDISTLVAGILDQQKGKSIGWSSIQDKITDLARYTELDLNVYTNKGVLYFSNQHDIYKKEIVSKYLSPDAYAAILEQRNQAVLLNENIGELNFNMVYTSIRSQESGLIYGVLGIPFFESKNELGRQVIEVLNTMMNVFAFTFIALLIVSYFASRYLTYPLHMITQKMSRISLTAHNEPLEWKGEDEIGKLVHQYNTMLTVLEENKKILTRTEKESAWKEMAKQVAHEIKNPLTPMKLTLQHMQRCIVDEKELTSFTKSSFDHRIKSLLSQIDNLSDIAGSFSSFATMPEPIHEDFDITALVNEVGVLHHSSKHFSTAIQITKPVIVNGDLGWMNNVLNNLIINAFQSIPDEREEEVELGYTFQGKTVLIYVKDNGTGIPEEIKGKIFQPNFSTKFAGSGIGLALAKRGVEYMGGKIWFETMDGIGTTFYIQLPIKAE